MLQELQAPLLSAEMAGTLGMKVTHGVDQGIIQMVLYRISEEMKCTWGFKEDIEKVRGQLIRLEELLQGVAEIGDNVLINQWLKKVKNVAYEADNLLDEYAYEAFNRRLLQKYQTELTLKIRFYFSSSNPAVFRIKMALRDGNLMNSVDEICKDAIDLGIKPIRVASGYTYDNPGPDKSHELKESRLQNREQWVTDGLIKNIFQIDHITKLLCDPSNTKRDLTIIGIVGLSGLGKTTLCKQISKVKEVRDYFRDIIWVVVSQDFDLTDILSKMIESISGSGSYMFENSLVEKLQKQLRYRKYLLILDDIWNTTLDWEPLRCALGKIGGQYGSCILTTSRTKKAVANMKTWCHGEDNRMTIQNPFIYQIRGLIEQNSWSLFESRVGCAHLADKEKQLLGRRMVLRCGGVPLAVRVLGDMLRNQSLEKWKEIEKSEIWEEEAKYGILPALKLTYHYLPDIYLKKCFLYCGIFKTDEKIAKDNLIQLWMAQGFLKPYEEMEATGNRYLNILLDRSLFQDVELDNSGNVKTFKIRNLVATLAHYLSGGECLSLVKGFDYDLSECRHLSTSEFDLTPELCNKLRTWYYSVRMLSLGPTFCKGSLVHCQQLRSLSLQQLALKDLPLSLSSLKHLRYLDISGNKFDTLPIVITRLYHLQTLRIMYNQWSVPHLPKAFTDLENLRHLICSNDIYGMGVPEGLGKMTGLRSLPPINMEIDWGGSITELGLLNNLSGLLKINCVDHMTTEEAKSLHFGNKPNVEKLVLSWKGCSNSETMHENESQNGILEALKPHEKLAELEIYNYCGTRFPRWLTLPITGTQHNNIVSFKLCICTHAIGDLNLDNFTSLRFLHLSCCKNLTISSPTHEFELRKLIVELTLRLFNWVPEMSILRHLRSLHIVDCPKISDKEVHWDDFWYY